MRDGIQKPAASSGVDRVSGRRVVIMLKLSGIETITVGMDRQKPLLTQDYQKSCKPVGFALGFRVVRFILLNSGRVEVAVGVLSRKHRLPSDGRGGVVAPVGNLLQSFSSDLFYPSLPCPA